MTVWASSSLPRRVGSACHRPVIGLSSAAFAALMIVESGGQAFGSTDRAIARFENHIFDREWGAANASVFNQHFRYTSRVQRPVRWDRRAPYGRSRPVGECRAPRRARTVVDGMSATQL